MGGGVRDKIKVEYISLDDPEYREDEDGRPMVRVMFEGFIHRHVPENKRHIYIPEIDKTVVLEDEPENN